MIAVAAAIAAMMLQAPSLPVRVLDQGQQSLVEESRQEVVRTAQAWEALWEQHSLKEAPAVDFRREQVVGIFLGSRLSAGYSVEIVSVTRVGDGAGVRYRERRPAADAVTAQVLTFPYCIVAVPASAGALRVERVE